MHTVLEHKQRDTIFDIRRATARDTDVRESDKQSIETLREFNDEKERREIDI